ncbi:pentapeptide repeat-containing protein [Thermogemmatispora sp.]|uniref:pentapeptide repeat-containing protein n=1 Tax=Thermogemmatispora sp. TaxID=1968838 RepID=UPI0035E40E5C
MSKPEDLAVLKRGVQAWNTWRQQAQSGIFARPTSIYGPGPDLSAADLREADLAEINLWAVNLREANLRGANLQGADLGLADLRGAILEGANLCRSCLAADLRGADLRATRLGGADLRGAWLNAETRLEGALLQEVGHGSARVFGLAWSQVKLTAIDWESVEMLGDEELLSCAPAFRNRPNLVLPQRLEDYEHRWQYESAILAYEELGQALKEQGLSAQAARFKERARLLRARPEYRLLTQGSRRWRRLI